jgi:hypothetical protein
MCGRWRPVANFLRRSVDETNTCSSCPLATVDVSHSRCWSSGRSYLSWTSTTDSGACWHHSSRDGCNIPTSSSRPSSGTRRATSLGIWPQLMRRLLSSKPWHRRECKRHKIPTKAAEQHQSAPVVASDVTDLTAWSASTRKQQGTACRVTGSLPDTSSTCRRARRAARLNQAAAVNGSMHVERRPAGARPRP